MNRKLLFIVIILLLFNVKSVHAMTLKPTGNNETSRGKNLSVYLTLIRSDEEYSISAIDGELDYNKNAIELISYTNLLSNWRELSGIKNNNRFAYANLEFNNLINVTNQKIIKLDFKVKQNADYGNTSISISNPTATDELGNEVEIKGGSHIIRVLSDINTLSNIIIDGIKFNFDETKEEFNLTTEIDKINIIATKKDNNSTISGDIGIQELEYGINTFKIVVTSELGTEKIYTINITRKDTRSEVNTLSGLVLTPEIIKFDKDISNYGVTVKNNISEIKLDATLTDSKSSFVDGYGPRKIKLNVGNNLILIKIKSEKGQIKTYSLNIIREKEVIKEDIPEKEEIQEIEKLSDNNYLKKIIINDTEIVFNKEEYERKITVSNDTEKININIIAEDEKATYTIDGDENLKVGNNTYSVKVKAQDETIREYKIIVHRKEENIPLSNNSKLKDLYIKGYKINFNKDTNEYTLKINKETQLEIIYTLDDSKSDAIIKGNNNLKNGSIIKIIVVAEDRTTTEYIINIVKSSYNPIIIVLLSVISGIVLALIIYLLIIKIKLKFNTK
ncbi:MAG: cadherin-like beta sandwich domain-containing protein [Firmicutes bacterium]|nr:cadherin-like beta sandwich domain-containing protein [Bacillota bacterium]